MLFTIGYEKKEINDFVLTLLENEVKRVVDVRELPLSRKQGYSKKPLSELLETNGIEYIHIKELGSPKELRKKLKENGDTYSFFKEYRNYLKTKKDVVNNLYNIISEKSSCLVCYEDLPIRCHRSEICHEIKNIDNNGLKVKHL